MPKYTKADWDAVVAIEAAHPVLTGVRALERTPATPAERSEAQQLVERLKARMGRNSDSVLRAFTKGKSHKEICAELGVKYEKSGGLVGVRKLKKRVAQMKVQAVEESKNVYGKNPPGAGGTL